ncbi:MerR family transcriptional regulator [Alteromonas sediminis]|nr:MerR family transcriptional regulator [Alteromonas sediminis]
MKISQFAKQAGVSVETVRYYHREGLLAVPENSGSYRQYTNVHINKIAFIQKAKLAGFTLDEIKQLERLDASRDKDEIRRISEDKMQLLETKIAELVMAQTFLSELVLACKKSDNEPCPILTELRDT